MLGSKNSAADSAETLSGQTRRIGTQFAAALVVVSLFGVLAVGGASAAENPEPIEFEEEISSELDAEDPGNTFTRENYTFWASAGTDVTVSTTTNGHEADLVILDENDDPVDYVFNTVDPSLTDVTLPETGDYEIYVRDDENYFDYTVSLDHADPRSIVIEETLDSELDAYDAGGSFKRENYTFSASAGTSIRVSTTTNGHAADLVILDENDDPVDYVFNTVDPSLTDVTIPETGEYEIYVRDDENYFNYSVSLDHANPRSIRFGSRLTSELDAHDPGNSFKRENYTFSASAGTKVTVRTQTTGYAADLVILDENDDPVDYVFNTVDPSLTDVTIPETGEYEIYVRDDENYFDYTVSLSSG